MTEKQVGFKRQLDAVGKAVAVYVPPAKRRQILLEKKEVERQKLKEKEEQRNAAKVDEGEPEGNDVPSSSAAPNDDAVDTPGDSQAEQKEQLQQLSTQRETWQDQRRVINGTVNRLNSGTIKPLIQELFQKINLVRLRGPLCKSVLSAAVSSPKYSDVYAAIIAVVNSKLPEVGELMVKRAILAFRRYYKQRDKASCQAVCVYIVHLFHQGVVHELIILQLLSVLLDGARPTDDSVEIAVHVLQIGGQALLDCSSAGVRACTERMRSLLHEGHLNQRVEYRVEELLKARKNGFKDFPSISEELDLVERDDQITFDTSLDDDDIQKEDKLDVFSFDPEFKEHEEEWTAIRAEILGLGDSSDSDSDISSDSSDDDSQEKASPSGENALSIPSDGDGKQIAVVEDLTEADLVHLRRTIYLTIMSSATFEECAHKLARINVPPGRESELINMLIECCSQERTFLRYYGLIASRFCLMDHRWKDAFMDSFSEQYSTIHRLETNKLRNVAKLFSHILHTDSIPWSVMSIIHLNEDETTSSSRIFIKIVIQEMAEAMGIAKLNQRFDTQDEENKLWYAGMFPKDNVRNTRYAINFFTSIGLGPLTDDLREFLKNAPKLILAKAKEAALAKKEEDLGDESSSVSSTSSSSFSSSSSSYSTSSYSSSTNSGSYSSSSYSRGRRRGRSSERGRKYRDKRRRHSSNLSASSSSTDDSSSRGRRGNGSRRNRRERSRSPPKVITKEESKGDRGKSANKPRSPSSSLSRSRRKDSGRQSSRDRSRSPPKVISSHQGRALRGSASRSPQTGRVNGSDRCRSSSPRRSSSRSPRREREKEARRSPAISSRMSSSRSPPRGRDMKANRSHRTSLRRSSSQSPPRGRRKVHNRSTGTSPYQSSSRSPHRDGGKESKRSNKSNRHGRSLSLDRPKPPPTIVASRKTFESRSSSRSRSSPRRSRRKYSRSRSRSQSRSPPRVRNSRRNDSGKRSRSRRGYRSNSSSRSPSSEASGSSDSHVRDSRRHQQSGRRSDGRRPNSSRSRSRSH